MLVDATSISLTLDDGQPVVLTANSARQSRRVSYEACARFNLRDEQCRSLQLYFEDVCSSDPESQSLSPSSLSDHPPILPPPPASAQSRMPAPLLKPEYIVPHHPRYSHPRTEDALSSIMQYEPSDNLPSELAQAAIEAAVASQTAASPPPSKDLYSFLTENSDDPALSECILIQIIGGSVYVVSPNERSYDRSSWWRQRRRNGVLRLLLRVASRAPSSSSLKDTELVFCPTDCLGALFKAASPAGFPSDYSFGGSDEKRFAESDPNVFEKKQDGVVATSPIVFSSISCSHSTALSLPVFTARSPDEPQLEDFPNFVSSKIPQQTPPSTSVSDPLFGGISNSTVYSSLAVFRGEVHGKSCWSGDASSPVSVPTAGAACGRRRLSVLSAGVDSAIDFTINHYVPLLEQSKYRLVMHVEGHCGWSDRLKFLLFMGHSCVVLQESFCHEWYAKKLEPWTHYIPVDYFFETLTASVAWGLDAKNTELVDRIVANKRAYANVVLSEYGILRYTLELLNMYTAERDLGTVSRREGSEEALQYLARTHSASQIVFPKVL